MDYRQKGVYLKVGALIKPEIIPGYIYNTSKAYYG